VSELEVTDDIAQRILRDVALDDTFNTNENDDGSSTSMVKEALRRMIVS